jgi:hypothetical protein
MTPEQDSNSKSPWTIDRLGRWVKALLFVCSALACICVGTCIGLALNFNKQLSPVETALRGMETRLQSVEQRQLASDARLEDNRKNWQAFTENILAAVDKLRKEK